MDLKRSDAGPETRNRGLVRELEVRRLGLVKYSDALELQRQLVEDRKEGRIPDQLLLLQHPQ
jgi:lipoyl(octanoyl) transferase